MSELFWKKVAKTDSCWLWKGHTHHRDGYGRVMLKGKVRQAHRISYELLRGPVPEGTELDHICRTKNCVNPDHLRAVTQRVNSIENRGGPVAASAAKTHCLRGHPLSGENLKNSVRANGRMTRDCRACMRLREQRKSCKTKS